MTLRTALARAVKLRENDLDDEKYANGIYDYSIETYNNYRRFLQNYGNSYIIPKLDEVDSELIELIYFALDEVLDIIIEEEISL
jgi:hypothetical protein